MTAFLASSCPELLEDGRAPRSPLCGHRFLPLMLWVSRSQGLFSELVQSRSPPPMGTELPLPMGRSEGRPHLGSPRVEQLHLGLLGLDQGREKPGSPGPWHSGFRASSRGHLMPQPPGTASLLAPPPSSERGLANPACRAPKGQDWQDFIR